MAAGQTYGAMRSQLPIGTHARARTHAEQSSAVVTVTASASIRSADYQMTNCPRSGRDQGQVANFRISHPLKFLWKG